MSTAYELSPCPACGASDGEEVAGREEVRAEVEALWAFHGKRLRPGTPPERLTDRVAFSQDPPLRIERCRACGLLYRNPRERERELRDLYAGEAPDPDALEALHENQKQSYRAQAARLTRELGRAGTVLEVGSYVGGFLAAATEAGWRAEGVDVNPHANAFAGSKGFAVREGDLESLPAGRRYDAVAIWNCFDQLPDPRRAAGAARDRLGPGGILAVRVPNGEFYARVRRHVNGPGPVSSAARALLAHNNLLGFPYRHGFTVASLRRLLEETGFRVVRTVGDTLVPVADEWTRRWASLEERLVKAALRLSPLGPERAPWIEVYSRVAGG